MKLTNLIMIVFLFIALAINAQAGDPHHSDPEPTGDYMNPAGIFGVASAISAAQCHFDGGSFDLQLCGGYGNHEGNDAYTAGIGQKLGDFLFNYTETTENGKASRGFGVNWKIKIK